MRARFLKDFWATMIHPTLNCRPPLGSQKCYRYGMSAQSSGDYAEALENYYEALKLEEDPYDRSYILYNIGLIYSNNGDYSKALEYYHKALELNARLPQALNNIAVIY